MNLYTVTLLDGTRMTAEGDDKVAALRSLMPSVKPDGVLSVTLLRRRRTPRIDAE